MSDLPPIEPPIESSPAVPDDPMPTPVLETPVPAPIAAVITPLAADPIDWPTTLPPLPSLPPVVPLIPLAAAVPNPRSTPPVLAVPATPIVESRVESAEAEIEDEDADPPTRALDPALAWIVVVAATIIGLSGLAPDVRYTVLWTVLLVVGLLAILFDRLEVEIPTASDMAWGIGYGLLLGVPLVVIALPQLQRISAQMFVGMSNAYIFQAVVLIMPASDALFFRGALQPTRGLFFTVGAASLWSILIFFPQLQVLAFPLVAIVIGFAFVILNFLYGYLKRRFGLFASWTCQLTINLLLLFVVRFIT